MANTDGDPGAQTDEDRVAVNVARLREGRGWSQGDVARAMVERGHSWYQTTVSRVEKGERPVRLVEGVALADTFGVSVDSLVGDPAVQDLMRHLTAQYGGLKTEEREVRAHLRALSRFNRRLQQIVTELHRHGVVSRRLEEAERALVEWTPEATWERYKQWEVEQGGEHQEEA